ncbi:MAG: NTP transferase domain-containing protein [Patescibacteria group bacterium]|nr:NTP transferase domain-containing protein [Patescibacteria group bacterium]
MPQTLAIVLAAGKGTRMNSELPKVLVEVCGRPMLRYVLDALRAGGVQRIALVVGHREDLVREALADQADLEFVVQREQLGTGHAVMVCREVIERQDGPVVVVAGDAPMMQAESIASLLAEYERQPAGCILGTVHKQNPTGLGRVLRNAEGEFVGIVEEKDATEQQRRITEVNMSYYVFDPRYLLHALDNIRNNNAQKEYYITDCPGVMINQEVDVRALAVLKPCEALGINTPTELAAVETAMHGQSPSIHNS